MVDARVLQQSSRLIAQPVSRSEAALEIDLSQMKNSQLLEALSHVDNTKMEGRLFRTISAVCQNSLQCKFYNNKNDLKNYLNPKNLNGHI